jgi:hypothetical protein
MDTTLTTKNCYFDHHIDRTFKPPNQEHVLLEPKGRRLFWNLKFNYPGIYNLRIQFYLPNKVSKIPKKTIEVGIWCSNESKELVRYNRKSINVNDPTQRYVWFDMGSYNIQKVGVKQFYLERLKSGKPFGISKICLEYCESSEEDFEENLDANHNYEHKYLELNKEINEKLKGFHQKLMEELNTYYEENGIVVEEKEKPKILVPEVELDLSDIDSSEVVDISDNFKLDDYKSGITNMYVEDKYSNLETVPESSKINLKSLLPEGITHMVEEVVPKNEEERKIMYHAEPAYVFIHSPVEMEEIGGIYREIKITKHEYYTYYTVGFSGGHIGFVLDGKKGYIKMELDASSDICSIIDKHPASIVSENGKVNVRYPHEFKTNTNYKLFIRTKLMTLVGQLHTVYYCYFEQANKKGWKLVGAIAKIGTHTLETVSSSIENVDCVNGHLYTRKLQIRNTWLFDKNRNGTLVQDVTFISKDPNNSNITVGKNNTLELQIGGRVSDDNKQSSQDVSLVVTGREKIPKIPWESVELSD